VTDRQTFGNEKEHFMTFLLENITRDGILAEKNKIIFKLSVRKLQLAIKYLIDFTAAAVGLILCSPIMLVLALAIKLASKGPIFFCQERLGKDARIFRLYKFRTMIPGAVNLGKAALMSYLNYLMSLKATSPWSAPVLPCRSNWNIMGLSNAAAWKCAPVSPAWPPSAAAPASPGQNASSMMCSISIISIYGWI